MPSKTAVQVVRKLSERGFNAEREAVTLLASADDPDAAIDRAVATAPDDAVILRANHVKAASETGDGTNHGDELSSPDSTGRDDTSSDPMTRGAGDSDTDYSGEHPHVSPGDAPTISTGENLTQGGEFAEQTPVESGGSIAVPTPPVSGDVTGQSTGTGQFSDFVATFRDRYDRLGAKLESRVNHRPADAIHALPGGSDAAMIGMVADKRPTSGGHTLIELEDPTGTVPCLVLDDRGFIDQLEEVLLDEVIAVEGGLADDGELLFVDDLHFPDVPRTHQPTTADRQVSAALISDIHFGSEDFLSDAWDSFTDWLHSETASDIEYLLIAGDMVEGVGVYPGQRETLDIVDVYDQYEGFSERLKAVPGDIEIVMIPGNHDAVRLAEPQPAFDDELRSILTAHDATVTGNPSVVSLAGVDVLMYHGVSLDEIIASLPADRVSYERPEQAMARLLKKRHLAPQFGDSMRIAPEERDYLVIDEVPDVFHAGHVHKLGIGEYHGVRLVNSGAWQSQTEFQQSVDLDPDAGFAPVIDLETLKVTVYEFR